MAGLTKQHFEKIANIINRTSHLNEIEEERTTDTNDLISFISDYFKSENPNFDEKRFIEACHKK